MGSDNSGYGFGTFAPNPRPPQSELPMPGENPGYGAGFNYSRPFMYAGYGPGPAGGVSNGAMAPSWNMTAGAQASPSIPGTMTNPVQAAMTSGGAAGTGGGTYGTGIGPKFVQMGQTVNNQLPGFLTPEMTKMLSTYGITPQLGPNGTWGYNYANYGGGTTYVGPSELST